MQATRRLRVRVVSATLARLSAVERLPAAGPHVVLTFDDGPDPRWTPQVMEALAEHRATATFFVLVGRARLARSVLTELRHAGHEIALHGLDHRPLAALPPRETRRSILAAKAELEDLAQVPVARFRPPYGQLTIAAARAVAASGMTTLLWNRATLDWTEASDADRLHAATAGVRPGDVLLAHDRMATTEDGAHDDQEPHVDRAALTRAVLTRLSDHGLSGRSARDATVGVLR